MSHHLSRMEERNLVLRKRGDGHVVDIQITAIGKQLLKAARPVHASAVRANLIEKIPAKERARIVEILNRLIE